MAVVNTIYNCISNLEYHKTIHPRLTGEVLVKRKRDYPNIRGQYNAEFIEAFGDEAGNRPIYFTFEDEPYQYNCVPYNDENGNLVKYVSDQTSIYNVSQSGDVQAVLYLPILDFQEYFNVAPYFTSRNWTSTIKRTCKHSGDPEYELEAYINCLLHVVSTDSYRNPQEGMEQNPSINLLGRQHYMPGTETENDTTNYYEDTKVSGTVLSSIATKGYNNDFRKNYYYYYRPDEIDKVWFVIYYTGIWHGYQIVDNKLMPITDTDNVVFTDSTLDFERYTSSPHFDRD